MSGNPCDRPGVVLEQMRPHTRRPGSLHIDCVIVDEETALRPHRQGGTCGLEGTQVRLLDAELVRVHDLLDQFVEPVQ